MSERREERSLQVALSDGSLGALRVEIHEAPYWIRAFGQGYDGVKFEDRDLFEALILLRREIEKLGGRLLCQGSRRDVFPSGMSRSMGGGRGAYVTRIGEPSNVLVDIFDEAKLADVGTVEEQQAYHREWFESLKRGAQ